MGICGSRRLVCGEKPTPPQGGKLLTTSRVDGAEAKRCRPQGRKKVRDAREGKGACPCQAFIQIPL